MGGTAGEPRGPGVLPCPEAPGRSSCAGLGEGRGPQGTVREEASRAELGLKCPILATKWQCTPRERSGATWPLPGELPHTQSEGHTSGVAGIGPSFWDPKHMVAWDGEEAGSFLG